VAKPVGDAELVSQFAPGCPVPLGLAAAKAVLPKLNAKAIAVAIVVSFFIYYCLIINLYT